MNGEVLATEEIDVLSAAQITFIADYPNLAPPICAQHTDCDSSANNFFGFLGADGSGISGGEYIEVRCLASGYCTDDHALDSRPNSAIFAPGKYSLTYQLSVMSYGATATTNSLGVGLYVISGAIATPTPEPGTVILFGSGIGLLALRYRLNSHRSVRFRI